MKIFGKSLGEIQDDNVFQETIEAADFYDDEVVWEGSLKNLPQRNNLEWWIYENHLKKNN